jgi:ligand-binding sensor domain-containing protein
MSQIYSNSPIKKTGKNLAHRKYRFLLIFVLLSILGCFIKPPRVDLYTNGSWVTYSNANNVNDLAFDRDGYLWAATEGGVVRWDTTHKTYKKYSPEDGLPSNVITAILPASDGTIWVGSQDGRIARFIDRHWKKYVIPELSDRMAIEDIHEDKKGNIWFATYGAGAIRINKHGQRVFLLEDGIASVAVKSILEDADGNLWFMTYPPCCDNLDGKNIHAVFGEKNGIKEGISKFDGIEWSIHIEDLMLNRNSFQGPPYYSFGINGNEFWVDSEIENRIYRMKGGIVDVFPVNFEQPLDLSKIYTDKSGNLWFFTDNKGIAKFDKKKWQQFTDNDGLISNNVTSMTEDSNSVFWFGTEDGISSYDGSSWVTFRTHDIYSTLPQRVRWFEFGKDGQLWIANYYRIYKQESNEWVFGSSSDAPSEYLISHIVSPSSDNAIEINSISPEIVATSRNGDTVLGIFHYYDARDETSFVFSIITMSRAKSLQLLNVDGNVYLQDVILTDNGDLWLAKSNGVSRFKNGKWQNFTTTDGLSGNYIYDASQAPDGSIWFVTDGGLSQLLEK